MSAAARSGKGKKKPPTTTTQLGARFNLVQVYLLPEDGNMAVADVSSLTKRMRI